MEDSQHKCAACNEDEGFELQANATCLFKQCECAYGNGTEGVSCPQNGAIKCAECEDGRHLGPNKLTCELNVCSCGNGTATIGDERDESGSGAVCGQSGTDMCSSCNTGYSPSDDNTMCEPKNCTVSDSGEPGTINCQNEADADGLTGSCTCDCDDNKGFTGALCNECRAGHGYNSTSTHCEPCEKPQFNVEISQYAPCAYQACPENEGILNSAGTVDLSAATWNTSLDTNCASCADGYNSPAGSGQCSDINECELEGEGAHECDGNATCSNSIGNYTCACKYGFIGDGYTCAENLCTCGAGKPTTGYDCPVNGTERCSSCHDDHELQANATCLFKQCECPYGTPTNGTRCPSNGAMVCDLNVDCDDGYHHHPTSGMCVKNECFCRNGLARDGAECLFDTTGSPLN